MEILIVYVNIDYLCVVDSIKVILQLIESL